MLNRLQFRTNLTLVFALILLIFGIVAGIGYYLIRYNQQSMRDVVASQDLLADVQRYEQCANALLLHATLGILLQNVDFEEACKQAAEEVKAIERKMLDRFAGEDAALFHELTEVHQQLVLDNARWFQIEKQRIAETITFDAAIEQSLRAMENHIEAIREVMNASKTSEDGIERVEFRYVEQIRKMTAGIDRVTFLRRAYFELRDAPNPEKKRSITGNIRESAEELALYLDGVKNMTNGLDHNATMSSIIEAASEWRAILESLLVMMEEQSQIIVRHSADNTKMTELLNALTANVSRQTERVRERAEGINAFVLRVEVAAAVFVLLTGLSLACVALKKHAKNLELVVCERTEEILKLQTAILDTVADMVEFRDQSTGGHNERTQRYLLALTNEMIRSGIYKDEISDWNMHFFLPSSQFHDLGKIAIPDEILNKPGKLSREEYEMMQKHVSVGVDALTKIISKTNQHAFLQHALAITGAHHEKWDGTGYPNKLSGNDIPLEGRLMAIADVYDALISARPYKPAFSHEKACQIIEASAGTHFDPILVEVFRRIRDDFSRIARGNMDWNMTTVHGLTDIR